MFNSPLKDLFKVLLIFSFFCNCLHQPLRAEENPKVIIRYFFQAGCKECKSVNDEVLPEIEELFSGRYVLEKYDVNVRENFLKLAALQEKFNITANEPVSMFAGENFALTGYGQIRKNIRDCIEKSIEAASEKPAAKAPEKTSGKASAPDKILSGRAKKFTLLPVMAAGFLDGINPCVFSTLIFLISILSVSRSSVYRTMAMGIAYCISCFVSYFALGFGLFNFIRLFTHIDILRNIIEAVMILILVILALISFRDAWLYKISGNASSVILQLPDRLKTAAHSIIKRGLVYRFIIPGAFLVGVLVTAIESVCTGQIYLPTLVFMAKESDSSMKWIFFLTLYNIMYILPLLFIFAAFIGGMKIKALLEISRRNVFISKTATGIFFIFLAVILLGS